MKFTLLLAVFFSIGIISAQVEPSPEITGDTILCPNKGGELTTTASYDSYQWYLRGYYDTVWTKFGNNGTNRSIEVTENHVLTYFKVEVTKNGLTEESPEMLLDAYAFLPPVVQTTGDFSVGNNGEAQFCDGDSVYFVLLAPYDTNITWFKDGVVLPKERDDTLLLRESGRYTVQGAPSRCPDFIQPLGLSLTVEKFDPIKPELTQRNDSLIVENNTSINTYKWFKDGVEISGASSYFYLPNSDGEFFVSSTDINGCESVSDTISYSPSVGIEDPVREGISIYPIPVESELSIKGISDTPAWVEIFDISGKQLLSENLNANGSVSVGYLSKGIYLVRIHLNSHVLEEKIIKQ